MSQKEETIEVNGNTYRLVDAVRLGFVPPKHEPSVDVVPSEAWTLAEIDAWADARSIDTASARTKAEKLALIADFEYTAPPAS